MVTAIIKFPGRKAFKRFYPTIAEAKKVKRFIGNAGKVTIMSRGKVIK